MVRAKAAVRAVNPYPRTLALYSVVSVGAGRICPKEFSFMSGKHRVTHVKITFGQKETVIVGQSRSARGSRFVADRVVVAAPSDGSLFDAKAIGDALDRMIAPQLSVQ